EFELKLRHNGSQVEGTMRRTNGSEPVDPITGTVGWAGTIDFRRVRANEWTQHYTGKIVGLAKNVRLDGTWTHEGKPSGSWTAELTAGAGFLPAFDVSGRWTMVVSGTHTFELDLRQSFSQIQGTMRRTNGDEPIDAINGVVEWDGTLRFRRARDTAWVQEYSGNVRSLPSGLEAQGTWTHDGRAAGNWTAQRVSPAASSQPAIAGAWRMSVSGTYEFELQLTQQGNQLSGTMRRINGNEPVDPVRGVIAVDGTVELDRVRGSEWVQRYSGRFISNGTATGQWTHNGKP
ncbi:MAG: hypothetical protein GY842_27235, partial [bacterium]|nr:hypothetical protein [bacterium]